MCSRQTFLMWLFVLVKLGDFTGDVFILVWLLQQNQINLFSITSPQLPVTNLSMEYCRSISFFNESKEIVNSAVRDGVFSTWTYLVIAGFCFLMFPAVVPLSIPPQVFGDVFDDNIDDDVVSIDYEFRAEEKGMKRMMRYFPIILLVIIHDITLSGIAMDVFSSIMSPHGTRCQQCFMNFGVGCSNDGKLDWNKAHIFPQQLDYYLLITIGTKIVSAMMSMGYIVYLELQYRYQLRVIQQQRNVLLLRRHFGRERTKMQNNCFGLCLSAFLVSFIFLVFVAALTIAPMTVLIYTKLKEALNLQAALSEKILIMAITGVSAWAVLFVLILGPLLYYFAFGKDRKCCNARE